MVNAFKFIIDKQGRNMTLERGATTVTVKMAPSNYFRNLAVVEEVIEEGMEFVVSSDSLDAVSFPTPRRGDLIVDSLTGPHSIVEVRTMFIFGNLAGYRLRTG
jgi:hypothetical protein